jgi:hypothetical protein
MKLRNGKIMSHTDRDFVINDGYIEHDVSTKSDERCFNPTNNSRDRLVSTDRLPLFLGIGCFVLLSLVSLVYTTTITLSSE